MTVLRQFYSDSLVLEVTPMAISVTVVSHLLKGGNGRDPANLADHRPISCFSVPGNIIHNALRLHIAAEARALNSLQTSHDQPQRWRPS